MSATLVGGGHRHGDDLFFEVISPESVSYTFRVKPAKNFGGVFSRAYSKISLVPIQPSHGCSSFENSFLVENNIALVERGGCSFLSKVLNGEAAGAAAVIVMDNDYANDENWVDMIKDETDRDAGIPALFLLGKDGYMIKEALKTNHVAEAIINIPVNISTTPAGQIKRAPWDLW